ncbi:energy-coupling factor transporter transmembrane component T family protein [Cellulomonas fimi]|uniref:Cobalt transport protein n=1 Tax=Cellulomonas fimi (strain ATCC 484 / DSM 20113 / JCM 1341 / CCUG 24087 / LMG 16345 / NBRC 15513 / NCIMB 8980 / NCTC 7547 / NRS-133) TaxID=590998 RepID=F4H3G6_CELFA|nr:energy-coupling factor transporter transmembrane component T [Cellulomonas fimi]AEE46511.1 cobalt transport protein [Cellulomonas fimi ATCC 484]NNH08864.1 energy-coupling factor transporter transmembrane protein EcfT [Cellulomonas fimi]VEH33287.1 Putative HMP/thiamine permease protein YkoC [Cellulomonas fimi]
MSRPTSGTALPHDSLLHRRNPTVKLAVTFAVSGAMLVPVDPWTPGVLLALTVPAVVVAGRLPVAVVARALALFTPFAVSVLAVNAVTRDGEVLARVAGLEVTTTGLSVGASLFLRTVLVGLLSAAFTLTTDAGRLMTSLHQHARLGPRATFAVLAGYRVLEQLPDRWTTVRQAQAVRSPARRPGAPLPRDPGSLARAAFAVLVVSIRQGERLAIALETRGLGTGPRTVARPVPLDRRDGALAAVVLAVVAGTLAGAQRLGVLETWSTVGGG